MADVGIVSSSVFEALAESAPDVIVTIDGHSTILTANAAVERVFGYTPEELIGRRLTTLMPERLRERHDAGLARYRSTGRKGIPWTGVELTGLRKDGSEVPIEISFGEFTDGGGRSIFSGFIRDISERIEQQRRLQAALAELRFQQHQLASVEQAIVATDPSGRVLSWNTHAERLYGLSAAEAIGRTVAELLQPMNEVHGRALELLRAGEKLSWEREVALRDGRRVWVAVSAAPVRDADGNITQIIGVSSDITKRVGLEQQFLQAQKLDAVGRLASGVAHDFNNLLTVIHSHAELLSPAMPPHSQEADDLAGIMKAVERATELTRQLLAFSRPQQASHLLLDVNAVVGDLQKMLRRMINRDVMMHVELGADVLPARVDRGQLEQAIMNLVVNARDAMPDGGDMHISTGSAAVAAPVASRWSVRSGAYVTIAVRDDGIGMTPETRSRIFEPFFTTKPRDKGTGLGLATVYSIVKGAGGFVDVQSAPGAGSTFTIHLPAH